MIFYKISLFVLYVKINYLRINERWKTMYPRPMIDYLVYFHSFRDYFECHEVLEDYWKEDGQKNKLWVGFIQLAVALYHHRRNNFVGAEKLLTQALKIFEQENKQLGKLGFETNQFINLLKDRQTEIKSGMPYSSLALPIASKDVLEECIKKSQENGVTWGDKNRKIGHEIIHKHKLRDRTAIIAERKEQLKKKRGL